MFNDPLSRGFTMQLRIAVDEAKGLTPSQSAFDCSSPRTFVVVGYLRETHNNYSHFFYEPHLTQDQAINVLAVLRAHWCDESTVLQECYDADGFIDSTILEEAEKRATVMRERKQIRWQSMCSTCGAPSTSAALDWTRVQIPGSTRTRFSPFGDVKFGCDLHPVTSEERSR